MGRLRDRQATDGHRETLGSEPGAIALRTRTQGHPLLDALALGLRLGLVVAPFETGEQSLPGDRVRPLAPEAVAIGDGHPLPIGTREEQIALALLQVPPRVIDVHLEAVRDGEHQLLVEVAAGHVPGLQRSLGDRQVRIGPDEIRIEFG
jgi:hypothetical protein